MKTLTTLVIAILVSFSLHAQWSTGTNYFYTGNNVGIGTTSSTTIQEKLHVEGNIYVAASQIRMPYGAFYSDVNNMAFFTDGGYIFSNRNNNSTRAIIASNGALNLFNSNSPVISINPTGNSYISGGSFGLGTSVPSAPLELYRIGTNDPIAKFGSAGAADSHSLLLYNGSGQAKIAISGGANTFTNGTQAGDAGFIFSTGKNMYVSEGGATPSFYIKAGGNIGIGTLNPGTYKMAVEGTLGARKVVVTQASWADFVFDSSYHLRSLEEVESFVKENKHLPEVPTTAEVTKDGVDLGQNQTKLLQKVEELTLYLIEQNKQIEKLKNVIDQQQKRLDALDLKNKANK